MNQVRDYFNPFFIPPLIASLLILSLGIFVYLKGRKSLINILFSLECITSFIWQFSYSMMFYFSYSEKIATFWMKIGYIGVVYITLILYHFVIEFLERKKERVVAYLGYAIATVFVYYHLATTIFTDGVIKHFWGYYPRASTIHPTFLIFFMGTMTLTSFHTFMALLKRERLFTDRRKKQIKYIFWAHLIYTPACVDFLGNYNISFYPFGYVFLTAFLTIIAYAIVKHRLMNIEVIVKKTLVFAGLLAFVLGIIVIAFFIIQELLGTISGMPRTLTYLLSAIAVIALYEPVKRFLTNITDKYLFQKKYNYKQILKKFLDEVITVLDIQRIVNGTIEFLDKIFHPERLAILLLNDEGDKFVSYGRLGYDNDIALDGNSKIITHFRKAKETLSIEDEKTLKTNGELKSEMISYKASLAIPLIASDGLLGVVLLGKKKSDELYSNEDLGILADLARTEAISISNSRTHAQLLESQEKQQRADHMMSMAFMVTNLSHELRNPLNNIKGAAVNTLDEIEFRLKELPPDKKQQKLLKYITESLSEIEKTSDKSTQMLNNILDTLKIDKSKFTELDIKQIIDESIKRAEIDIKNTPIKLVNNIPTNFTRIKGDHTTIETAIFNIMHNAIQAILRSNKGDAIKVSAEDLPDRIRIKITDNGPGIAKKDIKRIFEPFYTTKANLYRYAPGQSRGYGIGLTIVYQNITAHDGIVHVKSKEKEGTTFFVELPKKGVRLHGRKEKTSNS